MTACNQPPPTAVGLMTTSIPTQTYSPSPLPTGTALPPTFTALPTASPTPDLSQVEAPTDTPQPPTPTSSPTPSTTPTPSTQKPPLTANTSIAAPESAVAGVKVYQTTITLPTYPLRDYLVEQIDPVYNIPVYYFQRQAFEADNPPPTPVDYTGVVLENPYLRLTFLPELGGRLYSAVVKSTGQEIFYHNQVVKPSRYGVLQPYEANWWLAIGGMEWAYPTQEHGYRWGVPWQYEVSQNANGATITLSDTAPNRVGVEVQVALPAKSAVFTVSPKLTNATAHAVPVQFWVNAALALAPETMSPHTQFIAATNKVLVHSRGETDWAVPDAHQESPWPWVGKTDLRDYSQWAGYLGFFMPNMAVPFMGAHNPETNLGIVRLIEPGAVPGNKLFAFGPTFPDRSYTNNDSQYFEIWGGANTGFWPEDDISVTSGSVLQWQESWWPLVGLGGVTWANHHAAIYLEGTDGVYTLSVLTSQPRPLTVTVSTGKTPILTETFAADPALPWQGHFATAEKPVQIRLADEDNSTLLEYQR